MAKFWTIIAALLGASAVAMGAYHGHGLERRLTAKLAPIIVPDADGLPDIDGQTPLGNRQEQKRLVAKRMHDCDVAVKYQMYHALAIFGIGLMVARRCTWSGSLAALLMLLGVIGFSGGLYATVFDIAKLHWAIVPVGGLTMILGWLALGIAGLFVVVESCDAKK